MKIKNVKDVVDWRLCIGCGACFYECPEDAIRLINLVDQGIRPVIDANGCKSCPACLDVCPGIEIIHPKIEQNHSITELQQGWGMVLELWEGFASDSVIHYNGSSAGMASALALFCIEKYGFSGVLHIGSDPKNPLQNKTYLSINRDDLIKRTGSRYSPASPCDSLDLIESSENECAFIGKPCDIVGLRKAQKVNPSLNKKVGLAIGIFCAGTPSTQATLDLLSMNEVDRQQISEIRYRGKGWPGHFLVQMKNNEIPDTQVSYMESWGFLQAYRPYRCHLCPDGTSEFADISCGDPWYRKIEDGEMGSSLIVVRTERGREIIKQAREENYIKVEPVQADVLEASQINLLKKRRAIWGRIAAMKIFNIPTPNLDGFYLFSNWLNSGLKDKMRSFLGTIKRILLRRYFKPLK